MGGTAEDTGTIIQGDFEAIFLANKLLQKVFEKH